VFTIALGSLILLASNGQAAEPPAWKLPKAEGQKWAARITRAIGRDNWAVEVKGDEITVRRKTPVAMVRIGPNAAPNTRPSPDGEKTIRFVLRFGPKMTLDEYDRLAAVNAASAKEYDRLHRAVGLPHKFDEFIATTPEEEARVKAFQEAVKKLPHHDLPDLYAPENNIHFFHTRDGWSYPADETVLAECKDVEDVLLKYFGIYSPEVAANRQSLGKYRPEPRP
jgi:hypothetical protein